MSHATFFKSYFEPNLNFTHFLYDYKKFCFEHDLTCFSVEQHEEIIIHLKQINQGSRLDIINLMKWIIDNEFFTANEHTFLLKNGCRYYLNFIEFGDPIYAEVLQNLII